MLLAGSLLLLAAFLVIESRVQEPVLPLSISRLRTLAGLSRLLVTRGGPRLVMAAGMTLIGGGILWATQIPVHGRFLPD